jgi:hypothetical protein
MIAVDTVGRVAPTTIAINLRLSGNRSLTPLPVTWPHLCAMCQSPARAVLDRPEPGDRRLGAEPAGTQHEAIHQRHDDRRVTERHLDEAAVQEREGGGRLGVPLDAGGEAQVVAPEARLKEVAGAEQLGKWAVVEP